MALTMNYALATRPRGIVSGSEFCSDIARGFITTSRAFIGLIGCLTLLVLAFALINPTLRHRVFDEAPALIGQWLLPPVAAASNDVAAEPVETPVAVVNKDPRQQHVTQYLARRYRVADQAVSKLVAAAFEAGQQHELDPLLILAVMAIESSMNPFAQSSVGAQGLMQVMTRVHADKFESHGGDEAALDPIANIKVGSAILKDLIRRGGSVERGLQLYVGAGLMDDDGGYGARVLAERGRIAIAATGKVETAMSAATRAEAARSENRVTGEATGAASTQSQVPSTGAAARANDDAV